MWILALTLFLLGIMLIIISAAVRGKHSRCREQAQGVLMRIGTNRSRDVNRSEYYYSYKVDGTEYQFKSFDRAPQANKVGDSCTIWYNPKKPKEAMAYRYQSFTLLNILLISGIAMIVLTFALPIISAAIQAAQS
ncbi:MAG: DUF3592 domain-containing protein [Ruminococcus sp.]|nr:DUF3592 domain-containing protein [Ruminococcus sp.]